MCHGGVGWAWFRTVVTFCRGMTHPELSGRSLIIRGVFVLGAETNGRSGTRRFEEGVGGLLK